MRDKDLIKTLREGIAFTVKNDTAIRSQMTVCVHNNVIRARAKNLKGVDL